MTLVPTVPRSAVRTAHRADREDELTAYYYFELRPRVLTVEAVHPLSATLVRVRFSADDGFSGFPSIGAEDHLKLFFDHDPSGEPVLPVMRDGRWSPRGLTYRDYTVRWFDPEAAAVDIDFVLHDHGVAGRWASTAAVGQKIGALGPRGAFEIKDVFPWYVFAADETALPALARWVEVLRPEVPVTAYIEVAGPDSRIDLPTSATLETYWLYRDPSPAGTTQILDAAVRHHDFSDREGFVWVAGEAMSIKPLRRYISQELGFDRNHWDVDGYWRRGEINHDHHADD